MRNSLVEVNYWVILCQTFDWEKGEVNFPSVERSEKITYF